MSDRERLLAVAAGLFARQGYHGTDIADVAKAAGLGRDALHRHVESKEALLYTISRARVDHVTGQAAAALGAGHPPEDLLRTLARGLLRDVADHRAEWAVFLREHPALTGDRQADVLAAHERYADQWRQALDRGVAAGVLREAPAALVPGVVGMLSHPALWDAPADPDALADAYLDALLGGLRATRPASAP
ncbi:TetR family transcriptional regulator [Pseudonocardia sp. CNS-139]|nr:TetR family transcriptional regulator [Pseudonocardia sp. CNS-139]